MIKDSRWEIVKEYSGGVNLWIILWIWFNSKILKYQEVQNFAKSDTEKCWTRVNAQTAAFYASTQKPAHSDTWTNFFRRTRFSWQPLETLSPEVFLFLCSPYFIWESVVDAGVSQDSAERVRMFLTMAIYRKLGIHVQGQEISARLSLWRAGKLPAPSPLFEAEPSLGGWRQIGACTE